MTDEHADCNSCLPHPAGDISHPHLAHCLRSEMDRGLSLQDALRTSMSFNLTRIPGPAGHLCFGRPRPLFPTASSTPRRNPISS
ncbi:hypothetical protein TgHK011_004308 [Trichoderma gracile]|nr:hypothetical protein TgHK011_004308 [Trichoderma gracile]